MTKYECILCNRTFSNPDLAFDHLVEKHGEHLEMEYIVEMVT